MEFGISNMKLHSVTTADQIATFSKYHFLHIGVSSGAVSIAKIEGGNLLSVFNQYVGVDSERTFFSIFDLFCVLKYTQDEDPESPKK